MTGPLQATVRSLASNGLTRSNEGRLDFSDAVFNDVPYVVLLHACPLGVY